MKTLAIIPSRLASKRFPGKPLVPINGKPMIQHVYERASKAADQTYVATPNTSIADCVRGFGGNVVMTSIGQETGTDRCLEAYVKIKKLIKEDFDVIINVQGDEPTIHPDHLVGLKDWFRNSLVMAATSCYRIAARHTELPDGTGAYVVFDKNFSALYFSRYPIPYCKEYLEGSVYKHIGIYAFTPNGLSIFNSRLSTPLEEKENLEQNRWLENGFTMKVSVSDQMTIPVNVREDVALVERYLNEHK